MLTGDEIGVMKAVDAASATIMAKGYGEAWSSPAMASATGAMSTAVAVLDMKSPRIAVIPNRHPSTA